MATGDAFGPATGYLPAWRNVSRGFTLMIVAILGQIPATVLLAAAFAGAVFLVGRPGDFFERLHFGELEANDWTAVVLVGIPLAIVMLLPLVGLGGKLLCGSAPADGSTRGCAYGSAACDGLGLASYLVFYLFAAFVLFNAHSERDAAPLQIANLGLNCLQMILMPASFVLFMIYIFKIAAALESEPLRSAAKRFLIIFGVAFAGCILLVIATVVGIVFVVNSMRPRDGEPVMMLILIGAGLIYLGLILLGFVAYLWMLFRARSVTGLAGQGGVGMEYARG